MSEGKIQQRITICDIYLYIYLLYNGGIFFPGIVAQFFLIISMAISAYYFFYVHTHYKSSYIKAIDLLLALYTIYGIILISSGDLIYLDGQKNQAMYHCLTYIAIA